MRVTANPSRGPGRQAADHRLRRRPARPRVDHPRDGPPAARLLPRRLRQGPRDHQARRRERAVVRPGGQPRRLRLHVRRAASGCGARTCATTTATAQIAPGDGVDLNRNYPTRWGYDNEGSSPNPGSETYRGTAPGVGAGDAGPRRAVQHGSRPSSSSTTTRPPSCCCTASAGRSRRRRPTTSSTRRWSATTPTRAIAGLRPRHLRRAVHHQRRHRLATCRRRTARSASRPRWARASRRPPSTPTTRGSPRTARAASTSPTTRHSSRPSSRRTSRSRWPVAESAADPDDPVSVVGHRHPELRRRHASPCRTATRRTVAVTAKRALRG